MDDLKPCPFCGGEAKYKVIYGFHGYSETEYIVTCKRCGATMTKDVETGVIDAWNRRWGDCNG